MPIGFNVTRYARNAENLCTCMCHTRARSDPQGTEMGRSRDDWNDWTSGHHIVETPLFVFNQCGDISRGRIIS